MTLPPAFDAWFSQVTALDPERRFASATESRPRALGRPGPRAPVAPRRLVAVRLVDHGTGGAGPPRDAPLLGVDALQATLADGATLRGAPVHGAAVEARVRSRGRHHVPDAALGATEVVHAGARRRGRRHPRRRRPLRGAGQREAGPRAGHALGGFPVRRRAGGPASRRRVGERPPGEGRAASGVEHGGAGHVRRRRSGALGHDTGASRGASLLARLIRPRGPSHVRSTAHRSRPARRHPRRGTCARGWAQRRAVAVRSRHGGPEGRPVRRGLPGPRAELQARPSARRASRSPSARPGGAASPPR